MKTKKEELKEEDIQLLKTGMNDSVNLLNEDELDDIFEGYSCTNHYVTCIPGYYPCLKNYWIRDVPASDNQ